MTIITKQDKTDRKRHTHTHTNTHTDRRLGKSIKKNESKLKWQMAAAVGGGGTARNEAEKAHINNEMAQCSRGWGREREREGE